MVLYTDVVRMAFEFKDFASLAGFVFSNKHEACCFDSVRSDLGSLRSGGGGARQPTRLLRKVASNCTVVNLPERWPTAPSRMVPPRVGFRNLRHEDNCCCLGVFIKLCRISALKTKHVAAEFDGCDLEVRGRCRGRVCLKSGHSWLRGSCPRLRGRQSRLVPRTPSA